MYEKVYNELTLAQKGALLQLASKQTELADKITTVVSKSDTDTTVEIAPTFEFATFDWESFYSSIETTDDLLKIKLAFNDYEMQCEGKYESEECVNLLENFLSDNSLQTDFFEPINSFMTDLSPELRLQALQSLVGVHEDDSVRTLFNLFSGLDLVDKIRAVKLSWDRADVVQSMQNNQQQGKLTSMWWEPTSWPVWRWHKQEGEPLKSQEEILGEEEPTPEKDVDATAEPFDNTMMLGAQMIFSFAAREGGVPQNTEITDAPFNTQWSTLSERAGDLEVSEDTQRSSSEASQIDTVEDVHDDRIELMSALSRKETAQSASWLMNHPQKDVPLDTNALPSESDKKLTSALKDEYLSRSKALEDVTQLGQFVGNSEGSEAKMEIIPDNSPVGNTMEIEEIMSTDFPDGPSILVGTEGPIGIGDILSTAAPEAPSLVLGTEGPTEIEEEKLSTDFPEGPLLMMGTDAPDLHALQLLPTDSPAVQDLGNFSETNLEADMKGTSDTAIVGTEPPTVDMQQLVEILGGTDAPLMDTAVLIGTVPPLMDTAVLIGTEPPFFTKDDNVVFERSERETEKEGLTTLMNLSRKENPSSSWLINHPQKEIPLDTNAAPSEPAKKTAANLKEEYLNSLKNHDGDATLGQFTRVEVDPEVVSQQLQQFLGASKASSEIYQDEAVNPNTLMMDLHRVGVPTMMNFEATESIVDLNEDGIDDRMELMSAFSRKDVPSASWLMNHPPKDVPLDTKAVFSSETDKKISSALKEEYLNKAKALENQTQLGELMGGNASADEEGSVAENALKDEIFEDMVGTDRPFVPLRQFMGTDFPAVSVDEIKGTDGPDSVGAVVTTQLAAFSLYDILGTETPAVVPGGILNEMVGTELPEPSLGGIMSTQAPTSLHNIVNTEHVDLNEMVGTESPAASPEEILGTNPPVFSPDLTISVNEMVGTESPAASPEETLGTSPPVFLPDQTISEILASTTSLYVAEKAQPERDVDGDGVDDREELMSALSRKESTTSGSWLMNHPAVFIAGNEKAQAEYLNKEKALEDQTQLEQLMVGVLSENSAVTETFSVDVDALSGNGVLGTDIPFVSLPVIEQTEPAVVFTNGIVGTGPPVFSSDVTVGTEPPVVSQEHIVDSLVSFDEKDDIVSTKLPDVSKGEILELRPISTDEILGTELPGFFTNEIVTTEPPVSMDVVVGSFLAFDEMHQNLGTEGPTTPAVEILGTDYPALSLDKIVGTDFPTISTDEMVGTERPTISSVEIVGTEYSALSPDAIVGTDFPTISTDEIVSTSAPSVTQEQSSEVAFNVEELMAALSRKDADGAPSASWAMNHPQQEVPLDPLAVPVESEKKIRASLKKEYLNKGKSLENQTQLGQLIEAKSQHDILESAEEMEMSQEGIQENGSGSDISQMAQAEETLPPVEILGTEPPVTDETYVSPDEIVGTDLPVPLLEKTLSSADADEIVGTDLPVPLLEKTLSSADEIVATDIPTQPTEDILGSGSLSTESPFSPDEILGTSAPSLSENIANDIYEVSQFSALAQKARDQSHSLRGNGNTPSEPEYASEASRQSYFNLLTPSKANIVKEVVSPDIVIGTSLRDDGAWYTAKETKSNRFTNSFDPETSVAGYRIVTDLIAQLKGTTSVLLLALGAFVALFSGMRVYSSIQRTRYDEIHYESALL